MNVNTTVGIALDQKLIYEYFKQLISKFFKILPMKESNEKSLPAYIDSFMAELLGCNKLIESLEFDPSFLSLINILKYLADHPECSVHSTKREVFKAISICNRLQAQFSINIEEGE